ncbi:hypothetical protein P152DRAFT_458548 [Eremomyces bilateralis CBS 781.70]|uniref:DNA helicase n=1 Tax=Eremomyces bilateralis CBS 781.70 TaxID=1392243 RepID=A0A6G1G2V4_9PEZI|nr:uncharacterized protein P152DRAFT_458548 [Eremomyces bilateralis CBS 781.70]KAF1812139.1 hypothetical protein P152DRAFT_458548 [Eremomyces bilateralis CBS 781.70]
MQSSVASPPPESNAHHQHLVHTNGHHDVHPELDQQLQNGTPEEIKKENVPNGLNHGSSLPPALPLDQSEPPSKRRRLDSQRLSRPPSPPWKKVAAEGPSSFLIDGRRKSSRTNTVPSEPEPPSGKRRTRAESNTSVTRPSYAALHNGKHYEAPTNGAMSSPKSTPRPPPNKATGQTEFKKPKAMLPNGDRARGGKHSSSAANTSPSKPSAQTHPRRTSSSRSNIQDPSTNTPPSQGSARGRGRGGRPRKSDIISRVGPSDSPSEPTAPSSAGPARLRLRIRNANQPELRHLGTLPPLRKYNTFQEWLSHDDPFQGDEESRPSVDKITSKADEIIRLQKACGPGGPLEHKENLFDAFEEEQAGLKDPYQAYGAVYSHWDHVVAHATHFRRLMRREARAHVGMAKRIANEVAEEVATNPKWESRRLPVDKNEVWRQEEAWQRQRYKQVVRDMAKAWELVRAEVKKEKLRQWEMEQHAEGKRALDDMLDKAKVLVEKRRRRSEGAGSDVMDESDMDDDEAEVEYFDENEPLIDSQMQSDNEKEDTERVGSDEDEDEDLDSDVMSSTDDSEEEVQQDADDDAGLDQEALRQKYSHILQEQERLANGVEEADEDHASETGTDADQSAADMDEEDLEPDAVPGAEDHTPDSAEADRDSDKSNGIDVSAIELDEVDPMLLDDEDESTDMDSDMGTEESEEEESGSEEDEEEGPSLLGFFSKSKIQQMKEQAKEHLANGVDHDDEDSASVRHDEVEIDEKPHDSAMDSITDLAETDPAKDELLHNGHARDSSMVDDDEIEEIERKDLPDTTIKDVSRPSSMEPQTLNQPSVHTEIPSLLLRGTLREYQHQGLDWLAGLYSQNTNGILADEMGLGKTIQTISLLAHLAVHHHVWGPHLIVVPTSVMLNWEMEFKKWCPGFKILTYYGTQEQRKKKRQGWMNEDLWNVVITSYQLILQDAQAFKKRNWHYLVLDEAHNIKNFQTQRWQTLLTFKTRARLLLTGTPLQNNLSELWSLLFFLMPGGIDGQGGFAELEKFTNAMRRPADQILDQGRQKLDLEAQAAVNKLHEVLRPYLLRRLKADVEKQMPGKYEHVVYCRLSKRQRQLYDEFMGRTDTRRILTSGNYMSIINCLMSLRKVCNHPDLFETRQIVTSFALPKSVIADFEIKDLLVRRRLLADGSSDKVDLDFIGLRPVSDERITTANALRTQYLQASRQLDFYASKLSHVLQGRKNVGVSTLESNLEEIKFKEQLGVMEQLRTTARITRARTLKRPIYGLGLVELATLRHTKGVYPRLGRSIGAVREVVSDLPEDVSLPSTPAFSEMFCSLEERSRSMEMTVAKFGCITPAVYASDMAELSLSPGLIKYARAYGQQQHNPLHEAQVRLSIAFPDKRLLQYDCGKLQRLDKLLRQLQAGGHRALIFTQMTKVLDILESFLNIHGHRYLRLDGATKIEQRQILTERFNNDPRILCFILSSRSGGLGINLTGADTVIFYDLDWNPAMDKQCQDRCHRIGQTRDVHIYRFVSEYTIEANILRKSNQKRLLDDIIIQKGEFTTDYFNRVTYRDALPDLGDDAEASAAMDKVLGDVTGLGQVFESVEDREDAVAAKTATNEMQHIDAADFNEMAAVSTSSGNGTPKTSVPPTPADGMDDSRTVTVHPETIVEEVPHVDDYMMQLMREELKHLIVVPPGRDKKKKKGNPGGDHRRRRR